MRGWFRIPLPDPNGTLINAINDPCGYNLIAPVAVNSVINSLEDPCKKGAYDKITTEKLKKLPI